MIGGVVNQAVTKPGPQGRRRGSRDSEAISNEIMPFAGQPLYSHDTAKAL
jgi:hypothetical protein